MAPLVLLFWFALFALRAVCSHMDFRQQESWRCFARSNSEVKIVSVVSGQVTCRCATAHRQIIVEVEGLTTREFIVLRENNNKIDFKRMPQIGEIWRIKPQGRWPQIER